MKFSQSLKFVTLMVVLLISITALAADMHKGSLTVADPIQVNGKQLKPGDYTVRWQGEGPGVNLQFIQNGKEVATAPATVIQLDRKASEDATEVKGSGSDRQLSAIRFSGQKYELDLTGERAQAQSKTGESMK
jgi:hypothetical protein